MNRSSRSDLATLQSMAHHYGRNEFLRFVLQALLNAASDTSDFDDRAISENYADAARSIGELIQE